MESLYNSHQEVCTPPPYLQYVPLYHLTVPQKNTTNSTKNATNSGKNTTNFIKLVLFLKVRLDEDKGTDSPRQTNTFYIQIASHNGSYVIQLSTTMKNQKHTRQIHMQGQCQGIPNSLCNMYSCYWLLHLSPNGVQSAH